MSQTNGSRVEKPIDRRATARALERALAASPRVLTLTKGQRAALEQRRSRRSA